MKVASKIILVACLAFIPVLAIDTYLSLDREEQLFRTDMERDLSVLGAHLRGIAIAEWHRSGSSGVGAVIRDAREADSHIAIEWRSGSEDPRGGEELNGRFVWVEPLVIDGETIGAIALSESVAPMYAYLRATVMRVGFLTIALLAVGLAAARLLSRRLIGDRLDRLVQFAAETGAGQLGRRVDVGGRDEITRLGSSLGAMNEQLALARAEMQRHNDERLMMLQQLRHADRLASLGRLAASVAHELGTPLNVVMGHANRISEGRQAPTDTKESAATIHRQVKKIEATIRNILGFARRTPGEEKQIELTSVVESVCGLLRPFAERQGVQLEFENSARTAPVRGRQVPLEQALSNLVSNAIDASPEGGKVLITLASEERTPKAGGAGRPVVVVRVLDQGVGVGEADLAHIFEAFYTSKSQGTGLGLWLADGIVSDHEGSIEVENRSEGGACFAIVLPESKVD